MSRTRDIVCLVCGETSRWVCPSSQFFLGSISGEIPRQCPKCGASRIKYKICEDGVSTEEYPKNDMPEAAALDENASPKTKILSELYSIRSTLSIISENLNAIEYSKKRLINKYANNALEKTRRELIKKHLGKWDKYKVSTIKAQINQKITNTEKEIEALQKAYKAKQDEVVGFFQRRAKKRQLLSLQNQIYLKKSLIYRFQNEIKDFDKKPRFPNGTYLEVNLLNRERIDYYDESRNTVNLIYQDSLRLTLDCLHGAEWDASPSSVRDVLPWVTPQDKTELDDFITRRKTESLELIEKAKTVYKTIDVRDWGNVDLIIYYFETGRADNLKEALQHVDRQLQTNQLVEAIHMASNQIGESIYRSTKALGGALAQSFSLLSKQMNEQAQAARDAISEQTQQMKQMQATQISNQVMANALLANIKTSSVELARNMEKIKLAQGLN